MSSENDALFDRHLQAPALSAAKARLRLQEFREQKPGTILRFGFDPLDNIIRMMKGKYYLVASPPGVGKTSFGMQLYEHVVSQIPNHRVVIFSAEMDVETLLLREACARERLPYWRMVTGRLQPEEYLRIDARLRSMYGSRLFIDETPNPTLEHMDRELAEMDELGFVMFDYLQLAGEFDRDEVRRVDKISRGLAALAKKYQVPVLAFGHLNKEGATKDQPPTLTDLRYGGGQQPDGAIILRERAVGETKVVEFHVVKHRHGPTGMCTLAFDGDQMRFRVAEVRQQPAPPPTGRINSTALAR